MESNHDNQTTEKQQKPLAEPGTDGENTINESILKNFASSIRSSLTTQFSWEKRPRYQVDSKKQCPICLDDYDIGDEICMSPNHQCPHVFHVECMSEWLMKRNECPLCRADYLKVSTDEEEGQGQILQTGNGTTVRLGGANTTEATASSSSPLGVQTFQAVAVEL